MTRLQRFVVQLSIPGFADQNQDMVTAHLIAYSAEDAVFQAIIDVRGHFKAPALGAHPISVAPYLDVKRHGPWTGPELPSLLVTS